MCRRASEDVSPRNTGTGASPGRSAMRAAMAGPPACDLTVPTFSRRMCVMSAPLFSRLATVLWEVQRSTLAWWPRARQVAAGGAAPDNTAAGASEAGDRFVVRVDLGRG